MKEYCCRSESSERAVCPCPVCVEGRGWSATCLCLGSELEPLDRMEARPSPEVVA